MCCLFGLLDYRGLISGKDKSFIISVLSTECEVRGTDATGIAYNTNGRLCVYKRPLPANKMHYSIPNSARYILGHTRMTTQGSERFYFNNHPFSGVVQSGKFALAHNGIIHNDVRLRKSESLPLTKIQTDSYVAVQLIEKQKTLNFNSLAKMAEQVKGSFTFTLIDSRNSLYVVRGSNPFCIYHFPEQGFYMYASTEEILMKALAKLKMQNLKSENILLSNGTIMKINRYGKIEYGSFAITEIDYYWGFSDYELRPRRSFGHKGVEYDIYIKNLKAVAFYYGYSADDIDCLLKDGFSCEEIEEMLFIYY